MDAFLNAITAFPTLIFSVLMVAAILYWILVIIGTLDLDILHLGDHDAGHAGHDGDHDSHAGHNPNAILEYLRVGQVPLTIIASVFVFTAWSLSFISTALLRPVVPGWSWWIFGGITLVAALVLGVAATGLAMAPLAKAFSQHGAEAADDLIGKMVLVTSSTVDAKFGTARHDRPSGEDLILNVVCDPEHRLAKGEQAVVLDYDRATGVYRIAPLPHTRPGFMSEPERLDAPPAPPAAAEATGSPTQPSNRQAQ